MKRLFLLLPVLALVEAFAQEVPSNCVLDRENGWINCRILTEPAPDPIPTPSPSPTPSPDPTPVPSPTPSPDPTPSPSPTPSPDPTPFPSPSPTPDPRPTPTPSPSPSPSPTPSPSPSPSPSPNPSPQPGQCISFDADAPCLPDDPPGLLRVGDGRFAKGSAGPTGQGRGQLIMVTSLKGDASPGTIRWALGQIRGPAKIQISPNLHGTVELEDRAVIRTPYTTFDCGPAPSDFAITMKCTGPNGNCVRYDEAGPLVGSTHDVIVHGCRGEGDFDPLRPQVPTNDLSVFATFNSVPVQYPWDDKWASKTPDQRKIAKDILWSRNSADLCRDDCLIAFDGVQDFSVVGNMVTRSWHPTTAGGIKPWGFGDYGARKFLTWAYNIWDEVGSRAPRITEAVWDWRYIRNIISRRTSYVTVAGQRISPNAGLWLEDDYYEHDLGHVLGNLEIPGPNMDPIGGGCVVGSSGAVGNAGCEHCGNCGGDPTKYAVCNPNIMQPGKVARFLVLRNQWVSSDCITNPPGWDGVIRREPGRPAVPTIPELAWGQVLAMIGPMNLNAREQAVIDFIKAQLP